MKGAICGDFIGSAFEFNNRKTKEFELFSKSSRFTDDTVMTIATMEALLEDVDFGVAYRKWYKMYPNAGYGAKFEKWAGDPEGRPYNSWGNGSAMRVSPVGCFYHDLETVINIAKKSAIVSHNHSEGIKGAEAAAACVHLALTGKSKDYIRNYVKERFGYFLGFKLDEIRQDYEFDVSCQGSVPQAIVCFLESGDFEDAVRNAISIGGDSDTIACITGGIAEAFYKHIPDKITRQVFSSIPKVFQDIIEKFYSRIHLKG